MAEGWRYILRHRQLRLLFLNSLAVNGLIMAGEPPLAVLMLGRLGFQPWQYGLAFAVPCIGGLIGSRLARPLVARYGNAAVLRVFGRLRACWPLGLVLVRPGLPGLLIVMATELVLIICCSIFNPVMATYRLQATDNDRVSRVLAAWSVGSTASRAAVIALWGLLATLTSPRWALATAGLLLLATPLLLRHAADGDTPADGDTCDRPWRHRGRWRHRGHCLVATATTGDSRCPSACARMRTDGGGGAHLDLMWDWVRRATNGRSN